MAREHPGKLERVGCWKPRMGTVLHKRCIGARAVDSERTYAVRPVEGAGEFDGAKRSE